MKKLIKIIIITAIIITTFFLYYLYSNWYIYRLKSIGFESYRYENLIIYDWTYKKNPQDTPSLIKIEYLPIAENGSVYFEQLYNLKNHDSNTNLSIEIKAEEGYRYYNFSEEDQVKACKYNFSYDNEYKPCKENIIIDYDFEIDNSSQRQLDSISKFVSRKYDYDVTFKRKT